MHVNYQVQQIKGIQMRGKRFVYTRFLDILCVFLHLFQLLLKLKSDEKLISKIIFVECGIGISKCPIYSKILPLVLVLGTHF
jgi:hypothetical protein